jgi:alanyl-tRNA synthetase
VAEEHGLSIDDKEVEEAQEKARLASMGQKKADSSSIKLGVHDLGALEKMNDVPKTDDSFKFGRDNIAAQVKSIFYAGKFLQSTKAVPSGEQFGLLLDRTCFYAEQGGQTFDTGSLVVDGQADFSVEEVQVYAGYVLHLGGMKYGQVSVGDKVLCVYDEVSFRHFQMTGAHNCSFDDTRFAITTLVPTFSILPSARFSGTMLSRGAL